MVDKKLHYADEAEYLKEKPLRFWTAGELAANPSREPDVITHNTMRFDVHLAHVYAFLDDGTQTKDRIAEAIRKAIIKAVDDTLGVGLDGVPIPFGGESIIYAETVMLHRECVSFDLS